MIDKSNNKRNKPLYRKTVKLSKTEKNRLSEIFSLHGTKSDFSRESGVHRQSVTRILNEGKGEERIIKAMKNYYEEQKKAK